MKEKVTIYWSRRDFRLFDNPALSAALAHATQNQSSFLPLFILEDYMVKKGGLEKFGYPSRVFLSHALPHFAEAFTNFTVIRGKAARSIIALAQTYDISVFVNEDVYKDFYTQIKKIRDAGVDIKLYEDMLSAPKETRTGAGNLYSVFTPFKNAVWHEFCTKKVLPKAKIEAAIPFAHTLGSIATKIPCTTEALWSALDTPRTFSVLGTVYDIDALLGEAPEYSLVYTSEEEAHKHFMHFLQHGMDDYKKQRDMLDIAGTSQMSLALAWGLVSARDLRARIQKHYGIDFLQPSTSPVHEGPVHYISELIWREFYKYLLYQYPELMDTEFQERFRGSIDWVEGSAAKKRFASWVRGETGYPIVDAAMRELAQTGLMHNRARMIVASILTKNLGVDWRFGQAYFRAMLLDLDEASNNGGWQWGASVGADPKPIRIFNPYLQAENYDPHSMYQKKYLTKEYLENPPKPIVEHKDAREEAMHRYSLGTKEKSAARDY